jgi:peptidoglycan/xylan/chitin deacetylase (PgdA/CDA1 family)
VNIPTVLDRVSVSSSPFRFAESGELTVNPNSAASSPRKSSSREQIVLLFHGIGEPPPGVPEDERPFWIDKPLFFGIVDMARTGDFDRDVVFTFDDGNKSDLFAAEELEKAGLDGHFFVLSGRLDMPHFLHRSEARQLVQAGMEVGLHGHSHVKWRSLGTQAWNEEVHEARARIEEAVRRPVESVALPYGWYDGQVLRRLRRDGFERIYTTDRGPNSASSLIIRRTAITRKCSLQSVRDIIEDNVRPIGRVRRVIAPWIKRWR